MIWSSIYSPISRVCPCNWWLQAQHVRGRPSPRLPELGDGWSYSANGKTKRIRDVGFHVYHIKMSVLGRRHFSFPWLSEAYFFIFQLLGAFFFNYLRHFLCVIKWGTFISLKINIVGRRHYSLNYCGQNPPSIYWCFPQQVDWLNVRIKSVFLYRQCARWGTSKRCKLELPTKSIDFNGSNWLKKNIIFLFFYIGGRMASDL